MIEIQNGYARFQTARGRFGGLPTWARGIITLLALPGVALLALSIVAVGVSLLALLLLTGPAYRLLSALTSSRTQAAPEDTKTEPQSYVPSAGRKHVEVKIVEP